MNEAVENKSARQRGCGGVQKIQLNEFKIFRVDELTYSYMDLPVVKYAAQF